MNNEEVNFLISLFFCLRNDRDRENGNSNGIDKKDMQQLQTIKQLLR